MPGRKEAALRLNLASIPPNLPFLDTLAERWLERFGETAAEGMILLPTRRAARALADAFLHVSGGRPMLLPRITAIGALDETPLALSGALNVAPAVGAVQRLAALARMVTALPRHAGGVSSVDQAWMLARELASLMDEAEQAEIDLGRALAATDHGSHARHWEITLGFLRIVTAAWPEWLAERGLMNPAARRVALLDAQAATWAAHGVRGAVWAAGLAGALPAIARLLRVIAGLPSGLVVLPWWEETDRQALQASHPQAGLQALLAGLGATAGDVAAWSGAPVAPPGRVALLSQALQPAHLLHGWADGPPPHPGDLAALTPADEQEEAVAIALSLRAAIATPGRRAALVTPDRALAGRVVAELRRWGIVADDSAGETLSETPPAVFLRLVCHAFAAGLSPVPLLAMLKHPLAACGWSPALCRRTARGLERCLRGPAPPRGFAGLRQAIARCADARVAELVERLRAGLEPLLRFVPPHRYAIAALVTAAVEAAEHLAQSDQATGAARLWRGEEGEALADLLGEALPHLDQLPPQPPDALPRIVEALLTGATIRSRRALRGLDEAAAEHPRIFIWGLLEARLQSTDVVVLGGLTEGVWPPVANPGPWLSRGLRTRIGLPDPEAAIGQAAHDFVMAACCAPSAILSAPRRREGAPAVPARWVVRINARLGGAALPVHPAAALARMLDMPEGGRGRPVASPAPTPPVRLRPRRFSVSEIETLIADPFAIYAKRILRLRPVPPLDQDTDKLEYGTIVHRGIELFLRDHATSLPPDTEAALRNAMQAALHERALSPFIAAWWEPRMRRIADWVAAEEARRGAASATRRVAAECQGNWTLGAFTVIAKADRIEHVGPGEVAVLDYKTGAVPNTPQVLDGTRPQLVLEAAMVEAGAFPGVSGEVVELTFWCLTGATKPGEAITPLKTRDELVALVAETPGRIRGLLESFDDPARGYIHHPHPGRSLRSSDYVQLARAAETTFMPEEE
jgi:ATP-dependent helicase/nuclease subunit B